MIADRMWGTYWGPADPLPAVWEGAADIPRECPIVYGSFDASAFRSDAALAAAAAAAAGRRAAQVGVLKDR